MLRKNTTFSQVGFDLGLDSGSEVESGTRFVAGQLRFELEWRRFAGKQRSGSSSWENCLLLASHCRIR